MYMFMYLTKDQLRKLRGIVYYRSSSRFEYRKCNNIIKAYIHLRSVLPDENDFYFRDFLLARGRLKIVIERILEYYNISESDLM